MNATPGNPRFARRLEGIALLLIAVSAILFQQAATRPWIEGRSPGRSALEVSPIGITDYGLGTTGTAPVRCRWWPHVGDAALCEVVAGGEAAMTRLRRAYPLTVVALWTSVLALFLVALRIPRSAPVIGTLVTMAVPVLALLALWSLVSSTSVALSALQHASMHAAPRGYASMIAGAVCTILAAGLLVVSRGKNASTRNPAQP